MRSRHFLLALVVAAIALFGYYSRTQVNPVTGEKQHIALTVDDEKALGVNAAPEMAAQMGGEVDPSDPDARAWRRSAAASSRAAAPPEAHTPTAFNSIS